MDWMGSHKRPLLLLSTLAILVIAKESPAPETSVKPGINQNFLDPNLKVDEWLQKFEYPKSTMASLVKAMKPGAILTVVDIERIEGVSSEWIMGQVRAGKDVFRKEIEDAGLTLVEEVKFEGVKENYVLKFRKGWGCESPHLILK